MRTLILVFLACARTVSGSVCTASLSSDTAASAATWSCGHVPTNGDSAFVNAAGATFTWDVAGTVGEGANGAAVGTGTISKSSSQFTVTGSGTAFTTEVEVGDWVVPDAVPVYAFVVQAVTDNTDVTCCNFFGPAFTNSTFHVYRHALAVFGNFTLSAALIAKGHVIQGRNGTIQLNANLTLATSVAGDGVPYGIRIFTGEGGTSGSFNAGAVTIGTDGGPQTYIYDEVNTVTFSLLGTTLNGFGSASVDGAGVSPSTITLTNVSLANIGGTLFFGKFGALSTSTVANITGTRVLSIASGATAPVTILEVYGTGTDSNIVITDNDFEYPTVNTGVLFVNTVGMTFERNLVSRVEYYGGAINYSDVVHIVRPYPVFVGACNPWSFVGDAGSVLSAYFVQDEGPAQICDRGFMSSDTPGAGTWTMQNFIYETTGPAPSVPTDWNHTRPPLTSVFDHVLTLPMGDGTMPGYIYDRDGTNTEISHSTLVTNAPGVGSGGTLGAIYSSAAGSSYPFVKNSLGWAKAGHAALGTTNTLLQTCPTCTTANLLNASGITNNAHYNAFTGTLFDAAGGTPTAAVGYDGWRQSTKPTLAADVNLGAGTNETLSGPRFANSARNFYTFDSVYLGHTATGWVTGHAYSVGDLVSASASGFYAGATINYRCVTGHTSASGNSTNGLPGTLNFRTNWEPATIQTLRTAVLAKAVLTDGALGCSGCSYTQALAAWVRGGFVPQYPALWCSADDGISSIGAVEFCSRGKSMLAAIQAF